MFLLVFFLNFHHDVCCVLSVSNKDDEDDDDDDDDDDGGGLVPLDVKPLLNRPILKRRIGSSSDISNSGWTGNHP